MWALTLRSRVKSSLFLRAKRAVVQRQHRRFRKMIEWLKQAAREFRVRVNHAFGLWSLIERASGKILHRPVRLNFNRCRHDSCDVCMS